MNRLSTVTDRERTLEQELKTLTAIYEVDVRLRAKLVVNERDALAARVLKDAGE
jgi:hypothetical protein